MAIDFNFITYTSPSGASFSTTQKNWNFEFKKATPSFPSANGNGNTYQDLGVFSGSVSLEFQFFNAAEAGDFINAMRERGSGTLVAPHQTRSIKAQPTSINESLDLVKDVDRIKYIVKFGEDVPAEFIQGTSSLKSQLQTYSANTTNFAANSLKVNQEVDTITDTTNQISFFRTKLTKINKDLGVATNVIEASIDNIIVDPVNTIIELKALMEQPAITYDRVLNKINGYAQLVQDLIRFDNDTFANSKNQFLNEAYLSQALSIAALSAMSDNVINSDYLTKTEAQQSAQTLLDTYDYLQAQLDLYEENTDFQQDGTIQQANQNLIFSAVGYAYAIAFDLKKEISFLTQDISSIYTIANKYYPEDWKDDENSTFDFIIKTNNLKSEELIAIPPLRTIKVYV